MPQAAPSAEDCIMGQLIRFPTEIRKCPVGKLAFHPKYGVCNVIGANGFARQLEYGQAIVSVDVRQCRSIDPRKDLVW
jgi:hypothetical protein